MTIDDDNLMICIIIFPTYLKTRCSRFKIVRLIPQIVVCDQQSPSVSPLTSINFRCPEQFGYYADEYNCSKYFVCVFGEALHESCTGGLRFSSELQTCDWPRNVICPYEGMLKSISSIQSILD
ncbi:chitin binding, variant 2 [Dermatophagoides farinae]|uniref:Chitin binding, variant 2 n=1 Tax=Dermatophagoides farinae TaxID=6954 RepID=A0A922I1V6_DERFA|nr:chitin binding, variant 2 [Dermatophagoides farinae]